MIHLPRFHATRLLGQRTARVQLGFLSGLAVLSLFLLGGCASPSAEKAKPADRPNIVFILADDLGYGDLRCYNPDSKIPTPELDALAAQGMRFTDAHTPSAVCTPTRYGLLTGRYCWRSRLPRGVLHGYSPTLIRPERHTVADVLKRNGYTTACVGKWHLGLNWATTSGDRPGEQQGETLPPAPHPDSVDVYQGVTGGPPEAGFDYSFVLPASLDMEPYCYFENNEVVVPADSLTEGNDLNTGFTGAFWRPGRIAPGFEMEEVMPTFVEKATQFVERAAAEDKPFFLYLPLASPHTPWVPTEPYEGSSQAGPYGDFVHMVDAYVGKVLGKLDELALTDNTLVIFTSDNGPYWRPNMIEQFDHRAAFMLRGMKGDVWEGGHRVPFIARWPGHIPAGTQNYELLSLVDVMATCAELVGDTLNANEGEDSFSMLPALRGEAVEGGIRDHLVAQSSRGHFGLRQGPWKYMPRLGSGGFSNPQTMEPEPEGPAGQLYQLSEDLSEADNRFLEQPERVQAMDQLLQTLREQGHSRPMKSLGGGE